MRSSLCKRILNGSGFSFRLCTFCFALGYPTFLLWFAEANTCASKNVSQLALPWWRSAACFSAKFSYLQRIIKRETSVVSRCRDSSLQQCWNHIFYFGGSMERLAMSPALLDEHWTIKQCHLIKSWVPSDTARLSCRHSVASVARSLKLRYERKPGCERSGIETSGARSSWRSWRWEGWKGSQIWAIWAPGQACPFTVSKLIPLCTTLAASLFLAQLWSLNQPNTDMM